MTVEFKIKIFALHAECFLFIENLTQGKEDCAKWKDRINQKKQHDLCRTFKLFINQFVCAKKTRKFSLGTFRKNLLQNWIKSIII